MALKPITPDSAERFCGLIIAPAGMGKTSLIRTVLGQEWDIEQKAWVPKEVQTNERVCVISAESGLLCIRDLIRQERVEGFEIETFADLKEAYDLLAMDPAMKDRYQWVFIDSLTEISDRCNRHFKDKYPQKEKTFDRWEDYSLTMLTRIKGFRDLTDYNVVFTCLPTVDMDENKRRYIAPNVTGKGLKEILTSIFDEVFYMDVLTEEGGIEYRAFITGPHERFPGKDRSGKLALFEKPDLGWIKDKILGNGGIPF